MLILDRIATTAWGAVACALLAACSKEGAPSRGVSPGDIPVSIAVPASDVVSGFAMGALRESFHEDAFRIAKSPISVAQYRACVTRGACTPPASSAPACNGQGGPGLLDGPTYDVEGGADLPLTCATAAQAKAYCAWVGGALPTPAQWMLAARGPKVSRYAWGNAAPTCDQHPGTHDDPGGPACNAGASSTIALHAVASHPAGASPAGLEDVLLTPGELLDAHREAQFPACNPPHVACIARGLRPGAIDGVEPVVAGPQGEETSKTAAGFRCVLKESL
jgi:serine/threonine-protein kinase